MQIDLKGQVILVTGAAGGIGEAIVKLLASSGATVAIHYNSKKEEAGLLALKAGNNSAIFHADLNDMSSVASLFTRVVDTCGKVDVLVNNAGVFLNCPVNSSFDKWCEIWDRTMNINLASGALLCKMAIPHFIERGGGRIIHISSRAAFRGDTGDYLAYAASKAGMVSLSRSIARSFGKDNIKSFVVAPGFVRTPMADEFLDGPGEEKILKEIALPLLTTPDDIAPTVLFLASGYMDHVTGGTIDVNAASYVR